MAFWILFNPIARGRSFSAMSHPWRVAELWSRRVRWACALRSARSASWRGGHGDKERDGRRMGEAMGEEKEKSVEFVLLVYG